VLLVLLLNLSQLIQGLHFNQVSNNLRNSSESLRRLLVIDTLSMHLEDGWEILAE